MQPKMVKICLLAIAAALFLRLVLDIHATYSHRAILRSKAEADRQRELVQLRQRVDDLEEQQSPEGIEADRRREEILGHWPRSNSERAEADRREKAMFDLVRQGQADIQADCYSPNGVIPQPTRPTAKTKEEPAKGPPTMPPLSTDPGPYPQ